MRSMNKKEYKKKWYKEHRDELKQSYQKHRDEKLAYRRQYYTKYRDELLAHQKQYNQQNKDERLAYRKLYYEQNKDKERQQAKAWIKNHIERYRELERKKSSKRQRGLGFVPLNKPFEGSEAHHICPTFVIYIPKDMHRSIYHNVWTGKNMEEINQLAWEELYKQRATNTLECVLNSKLYTLECI